ncbi:MAG: LacI family DNA-binding transcriptional regulator [Protaetiibacter sp.]
MGSHRATTLQDIADRLGVSRSTVSYAITGRGRVSERTRRQVLDVAHELGYRPNPVARHLRGSRTGVVALMLPRHTTTMSYYMEATFGVAEEAERSGMIVSLLTSGAAPTAVDRVNADGIILLDPDADDPSARTVLSGGAPVVTGEPVPPGLPAGRATVMSDHARGIAELMDHLFERGARHPALVLPQIRLFWVLSVRAAFERWCAAHGVVPRIVTIPHPATPEDIDGGIARLLAEGPATVDAIVAGSDGVVLNIVTGAERRGRRVGADLLVATAVDAGILELTRPSITALDLHPRQFGRQSVRALLALIEADAAGTPVDPVTLTVPIELVRRASTTGGIAGPAA